MKTAQVLFVVLASCLCVSYCKDLIVGTSFNNRLLWQEKAEYNAIPLKKRVKEVFYSDPGQQIIKDQIFDDYESIQATSHGLLLIPASLFLRLTLILALRDSASLLVHLISFKVEEYLANLNVRRNYISRESRE